MIFCELCKAAKDVQKDKRNQRRTELVRWEVFSASPLALTAFISSADLTFSQYQTNNSFLGRQVVLLEWWPIGCTFYQCDQFF
jgi:hypothetical protein